MMVDSLQDLTAITMKMKVGQSLTLSLFDIKRISPDNWLTGESGIDRLKSNIVGSAYDWDFRLHPMTGDLTMRKVEADGKRRHVDYDRREFFDEQPDGTFVRNDLLFKRREGAG